MTNIQLEKEVEREKLHRNIMVAVSHDLKTPLSCIIGSLEIYQRSRDRLSEDQKESLIHTALTESHRLDQFITNILDMARLDGGLVAVEKEKCSIQTIILGCIIRLGNQLGGHSIKTEIVPSDFYVVTDPVLLERALCVILDNASKYAPAGSMITIRTERDAGRVLISIQDEGSGIPSLKQNEIFLKYTRVSHDLSHSTGAGLGLAICREMMRLLGGAVTVESLEGTGSTFILSFPE